MVAIRGDFFNVIVPGLARVEAELLARLTSQQIPRTFDIVGGKRFAVMPFDIVAQMKG
jgi:hypothetical protein